MVNGIPIVEGEGSSAVPEHCRTKGTCVTDPGGGHVKQTTCDCGRYRVFEAFGVADEGFEDPDGGVRYRLTVTGSLLRR